MQVRLPRAPSNLALNTSRDGRGIHSLSGQLFQHLTALSVKNFPLISNHGRALLHYSLTNQWNNRQKTDNTQLCATSQLPFSISYSGIKISTHQPLCLRESLPVMLQAGGKEQRQPLPEERLGILPRVELLEQTWQVKSIAQLLTLHLQVNHNPSQKCH